MPKISIIIPVFNSEPYLEECLLSISQQTYTDFEILAINDGSSDRSIEILKEYQKKEARLKIFSQENKGVSAARNLGLDNAKGEYITFVDADDWLHPATLGHYIDIVEHEGSDIIISQFLTQKSTEKQTELSIENSERKDIEQKIFPKFIESDYYNSVCNKFYTNDLIKKSRAQFPVGVRIAEDAQFNHQVFSLAQKISETQFQSYFYREVEGSATKNVVRNDYLQSNVAIYQYDYQKYFGNSISDIEILRLKKRRFFRSIIALIYIYFHPKNQFSWGQRFSKIKEIINHEVVKQVFSDDALKQNLGRYDQAIFNAIQSKNILKLYLYTLYSYIRNQ
ncbi:glycosyltransferase family 2 protein [Cloacibacterium rupense]|uniref:glycosyltransferase family 2 protein n=1 Tax=Cloacibacterium rupense TaxID=517423 RepID=UPI001667356E|nr:glycosyltransferase family 2 protein [Cloacibacterium rupense]